MRGLVPGLLSPHPIGDRLPALYQDDDLVQRFAAGLDDVLAPVLATLDSSEAYIDPRLAPLDFVVWLSQWVGVELDGTWAPARQRALVARAAELVAGDAGLTAGPAGAGSMPTASADAAS